MRWLVNLTTCRDVEGEGIRKMGERKGEGKGREVSVTGGAK